MGTAKQEKTATAGQAPPSIRRLTDQPDYARAAGELAVLESTKAEAARRLDILLLRSNRASEEARRYINRDAGVLRSMSEAEFDELAERVGRALGLTEELAKIARSGSPLPDFMDSNDAGDVEEVHDARRAVLLLDRAVALRRKEANRRKNVAIAEVVNSVQGERETIALRLANSILDLAAAAAEENALLARLRLEDSAIPAMLSPAPFQISFFSEPFLIPWLATALKVTEREIRLTLSRVLPGSAKAGEGERSL